MSKSENNASYQALVYLIDFFSQELSSIETIWNVFCDVMLESNKTAFKRDDSWEQDWWLAKYAGSLSGAGVYARYLPPGDISEFPRFDIESHLRPMADNPEVLIQKNQTDLSPLASFQQAAKRHETLSAPYSLDQLYDLNSRIQNRGDIPMIQFNQILAWANLALGKLFTGILLTPIKDNFEDMYTACHQRWSQVWAEKDLYEDHMKLTELIQWKLDVFYGAIITKETFIMHPSRQGQPEQWREFWGWLSADLDWENALTSVRVAAGLLNPVPNSLFFQQLFRSMDDSVRAEHLMATAIFRRWVLTLRVMVWLEKALQHRWEFIRPKDLMCFAYSALRPHWPRRILAISHRSRDVKPVLKDMKIWDHFSFSIDANFIPQWETNTAMIWGLFSAVPGLIRIASAHYDQSIWCHRESELFNYLFEKDDFFQNRYLIDIDVKQTRSLDRLVPDDDQNDNTPISRVGFPGPTTVFMLYPFEPWENELLACVGVVRLLYIDLLDVEKTNELCLALAKGLIPPKGVPSILNHPDGWPSIARILGDFHAKWADDPNTFPLRVSKGHLNDDHQQAEARQQVERILDLSEGTCRVQDVMAAFEWYDTLLPTLIGDNRYGNFLAIDFRHLSSENWLSGEQFMVSRGIKYIRTSIPIWYIQTKDQSIEEWAGLTNRPIFTQHTPKQWNWMWELLLEPQWPARYEADSKVHFSKKLAEACAATQDRDSGYYREKII